MRRRHLVSVFIACWLVGGCGQDITLYFQSLFKPNHSYSYYHSYGDSITAGYGLSSPATRAYPGLLAVFNGLPLNNYGLAGDQACDVPTRQIFPAHDHPTLTQRGLYTLLISTNDVNIKGGGPYEDVFNLCHQASITWLGVPEEWKVEASSGVFRASGPTHTETTNNWNSLMTDAQGASVEIPFSRPDIGAVYVWYRIGDGNSGTFTYALDGTILGTAVTGVSPAIATQNGTDNSFALLRLPKVAAGSHTLRFTQTSAANSGMGIIAIGIPQTVQSDTLPRVLVGTTPLQLKGGNGRCSFSTMACDAYIADITANVALFKSDGLNVSLFESRMYEQGTTFDLIDSFHPNENGHQELFRSVEDVL